MARATTIGTAAKDAVNTPDTEALSEATYAFAIPASILYLLDANINDDNDDFL